MMTLSGPAHQQAFLQRLTQRVRKHLDEYSTDSAPLHLLVAFSGGMDSTVLLHALAQLAAQQSTLFSRCSFHLSAAHIHHGLSPHADAWAQKCQQFCDALNVPLQIFPVHVERHSGQGLEAAARTARHDVLASLSCDWIVLAHHRGDQAETLLHRLVRGTGVTGAGAMRERDATRHLWRPLLDEPRAQLEAYARSAGLSWVEDESNMDPRYTRNLLRHQILAPLNKAIPQAENNMVRAARHFSEAAGLLGELADMDIQHIKPESSASRSALLNLSEARARNLLRRLLTQRGEQAPEEAHLNEVLKQLGSEASAVHCVMGHSALCAYRNAFWIESAGLQPYIPVIWQGERFLPWGDGWIELVEDDEPQALLIDPALPLSLTGRQGGECLRLHAKGPSHSLKQLCQEAGIPPWRREQLPVLRQVDQVVWIGSLGADCRYVKNNAMKKGSQRGLRITWIRT